MYVLRRALVPKYTTTDQVGRITNPQLRTLVCINTNKKCTWYFAPWSGHLDNICLQFTPRVVTAACARQRQQGQQQTPTFALGHVQPGGARGERCPL